MEIILLEKIPNLGSLGDKVSVKPGYGRNYLIPQGKAVVAVPIKFSSSNSVVRNWKRRLPNHWRLRKPVQ